MLSEITLFKLKQNNNDINRICSTFLSSFKWSCILASVKNELQFGVLNRWVFVFVVSWISSFYGCLLVFLDCPWFVSSAPIQRPQIGNSKAEGTLNVDIKLLEKVAGKTNSHCFVTIVICFWLILSFQFGAFSLRFRLISCAFLKNSRYFPKLHLLEGL